VKGRSKRASRARAVVKSCWISVRVSESDISRSSQTAGDGGNGRALLMKGRVGCPDCSGLVVGHGFGRFNASFTCAPVSTGNPATCNFRAIV
jgi:hypothetical protein